MPKQRAIVMGGSLGGLNAALYLQDAGFDVTIFERSAESLAGQGAGIVLNPYTVRYFTDSDTLDVVADISVGTRYVRYLDAANQIVAQADEPYRFGSYNSIYAGLLAAFGEQNYLLNQRVVAVSQDADCVTVTTAAGRRERCDLLVCADGIRSTAKRWLTGQAALDYAGYVAWRGILKESELSPAIRAKQDDAIIYHITPHGHLLTYPIPVVSASLDDAETYINWLWYRNVAAGAPFEQLMTDREGNHRSVSLPPGQVPAATVAALKRDARTELPQLLVDLIEQTDEPFIQAVYDGETERMSFGRICLLGDAAFSARPHAAAGTAKAAEDGYHLGQALRETTGDIPSALKLFAQRQLELGRSLNQRNRVAGAALQNGTWPVGAHLAFGLYEQGDSEMI